MMKEEGGQRCRIALVGNPNVGKSVIFGFLSGRYATVSNYSGTTVEITTGETSWEGKKVTLIDTPGIQTLIPMSEEEKVTREILTGVDAVIQVGDAKNLGRTLFLSLQLAEIGIPFLLALNMEDESGALGISVDKKRLATLLGIPVVGTIAIQKKGLPEIRHQLLGLLSKNNGSGEAIRHEPPSRMIDQQRFQRVDALVGEVTRRDSPPRKNHREWIGRISTHPIWGVPVLGAVLLAIYEFVGKFGAQTMVGWLEEGLFGRLPAWATFIWSGVVLGSIFAVGLLAARLLPGERSLMIVEIPPIRRPTLTNIVSKTLARLEWYLKEVIPLFVLGTLALFLMDRFHFLPLLQDWASPLTEKVLNLPPQASEAFLIGFLRRDYGATRFFDLYTRGELDPVQTVVSLVVITLFIPCLANVLMVIKERGLKVAAAIVLFIYPFSFLIGGAVNFILRR